MAALRVFVSLSATQATALLKLALQGEEVEAAKEIANGLDAWAGASQVPTAGEGPLPASEPPPAPVVEQPKKKRGRPAGSKSAPRVEPPPPPQPDLRQTEIPAATNGSAQ